MPTHAETYRRFGGRLAPTRFRPWPVAAFGLRLAFKSRLALLLLLVIPAGWTVVFCFQVYSKFALESGTAVEPLGGLSGVAGRMLARSIDITQLIVGFYWLSRFFALLMVAWFGAGLLADDRRLGAHLLYFSRPITRLDYLLGKFLVAFLLGSLLVLVPGLFICLTATMSSPDYAWIREYPEVVWGTAAYGVIVGTTLALITLAVSSVVPKKIFGLLGVFGVMMVTFAAGRTLSIAYDSRAWRAISPMSCFHRVSMWLLNRQDRWSEWPVEWAFAGLLGWALLSVVVLVVRVRRLEVVG